MYRNRYPLQWKVNSYNGKADRHTTCFWITSLFWMKIAHFIKNTCRVLKTSLGAERLVQTLTGYLDNLAYWKFPDTKFRYIWPLVINNTWPLSFVTVHYHLYLSLLLMLFLLLLLFNKRCHYSADVPWYDLHV